MIPLGGWEVSRVVKFIENRERNGDQQGLGEQGVGSRLQSRVSGLLAQEMLENCHGSV